MASKRKQEGAKLHVAKKKDVSGQGIFQLLLEAGEKQKRIKREQLLQSVEVKDFFEEGDISINERTCQGLECELCIKACPTMALYWWNGRVGIVKDLCVYCGACVVNCIVDDCIKVTRKRSDGKVESFSKPSDVVLLFRSVNSGRRRSRVKEIIPDAETYIRRFCSRVGSHLKG